MSYKTRLIGSIYLLSIGVEVLFWRMLVNASVSFELDLIRRAPVDSVTSFIMWTPLAFIAVAGGLVIAVSPFIAARIAHVLLKNRAEV